jgi:SlyX protein
MEERVIELETRLAFQEDAVQHLNQVVARQQRLIDELSQRVELLKRQIQHLAPSPLEGGETEPPPPHY